MEYVTNYLVPSMTQQGIDDVVVMCDVEHLGNLESCMSIFQSMQGDGGAWHLQDDVIICKDFAKQTVNLEPSTRVICGFVWRKDESFQYVDLVKPERMWWSFPCIYIPNHLARECAEWFYTEARQDARYAWWVEQNKFDDYFFKEFLIKKYPHNLVLNYKPCLVDHIDFLIGGSVANGKRKDSIVRAEWFEDLELVDELEQKLESNGYGKKYV